MKSPYTEGTEGDDIWRDHEVGLIIVSMFVFAVSLFLPVAPPVLSNGPIHGFQVLLMINLPGWWANPLLWFAWFAGYHRWPAYTLVASLLAWPLALSPLFMFQPSDGFFIGYYSWLGSFAIANCAGVVGLIGQRLPAKAKQQADSDQPRSAKARLREP